MLNIAICDDEDIFVKKISEIVLDYFNYVNIEIYLDTYQSGMVFTHLKEAMNKYDIVFMDINMDGIEASQIMRRYCPDTYLVLVTAFFKYIFEGYKVEATRFILKDYETLEENIIEALDTILNKMNIVAGEVRYTFVGGGEADVNLTDILYVDHNLHKVTMHTWHNGDIIIRQLYRKLDEILHDFDSQKLVQTHQSFAINIQYVKNIKRYEAELINGERIPISKHRYNEVLNVYLSNLRSNCK